MVEAGVDDFANMHFEEHQWGFMAESLKDICTVSRVMTGVVDAIGWVIDNHFGFVKFSWSNVQTLIQWYSHLCIVYKKVE